MLRREDCVTRELRLKDSAFLLMLVLQCIVLLETGIAIGSPYGLQRSGLRYRTQ